MDIISPRSLFCCLGCTLLCLSSCKDPNRDESQRIEVDKQNKLMLNEIQQMEKKIADVPPANNLTERATQAEYNIQILMRQEKEIDDYIDALNLRLAGLNLKFETFKKDYPMEDDTKTENTKP